MNFILAKNYYQKSLIFRINILQEYSSVQSLLLYLRIFSQDFPHISYNDLRKQYLILLLRKRATQI